MDSKKAKVKAFYVKPVKLIFCLYFPKCLQESKDEISVLPVLHLLVFLLQTMFLLLVIVFVMKLHARNDTFKGFRLLQLYFEKILNFWKLQSML